ncbi:hypothetical protein SAY86_025210 [Trapa natans]|uniref:Protein kinase domain-containing protein n=1 Tax=Trapa natans TaxID=22666 RepID=A0AAN7M5U9_TRANT|nr:hypothetical protein SAY86_025210 [Trapa natans]
MADTKGDTSKKQQHHHQQQPSQVAPHSSSSPVVDSLDESPDTRQAPPAGHHHHQAQPPSATPAVVVAGSPFIPAPLFFSAIGTAGGAGVGPIPSPFHHEQLEVVNPKRPRFGQWKLLGSPTGHHQLQSKQLPTQMTGLPSESSPSPTQNIPQSHVVTTASSSDTASSPTSQSPIPAGSGSAAAAGAGHEIGKPDRGGSGELSNFHHHPQFRKGKYVSPVWKPNEMLWLARAWRIQYQGGSSESDPGALASAASAGGGDTGTGLTGRGKTRAEKDREVAEFLNRHGVNRDAKTAGTKWDNMLGEFRKVYEWERGGEREQVGKSYFRLSPYERKIHRLPASFDEEVFDELSRFMGARMRTPHVGSTGRVVVSSGIAISAGSSDAVEMILHPTAVLTSAAAATAHHSLEVPPPPPPFKDDQLPLAARAKQLAITSGVETFFHGSNGRGGLFLGYEPTSSTADAGGSSLALGGKELHRIGRVRMTWEESVSLWAEEGEQHRGRIRIQGSMSFLNADELTFLDESMVACPMEAFEDGPLKGFSVDRFVPGQQVKVFGRRKSALVATVSGFPERVHHALVEPSARSSTPSEFQDPSDYYLGCLRIPPPTLPSLFELSWYVQEPPPEELRIPLRRDVYRDLPQGRESFFTTSSQEPLDCRAFALDILSPMVRNNPGVSIATASSRDSFIGLWDDCINRVVSKFCSIEMTVIRKSSGIMNSDTMHHRWPNVTGFLRNFCLWRGEETDQLRDGALDPSTSIIEKLSWTFADLPYLLGYYAVGCAVTFCALSRLQDRIVRTDLYSIDLSTQSSRMKALIPCYRIAGLLALLSDRCFNNLASYKPLFPYSDFERMDLGNGEVIEITPTTVTRFFQSKRRWAAVKEIYDFLDQRVPHAEFIFQSSEKDLGLVFKPRGIKCKPASFEQLVEALMYVTKALVALHDLSFMHRDLSWDKVMRRSDNETEWVVCGFEEAAAAPQIYPHGAGGEVVALAPARGGTRAPEMVRGLHNVKVDVWGVGYLIKTCGIDGIVPKLLRELQNRCLDQNPEHRPTAADCYHHLLQLQSTFHSSSGAAGGTY